MRMRLVDEAECAQLAKYTQWAKCAKTDNRQHICRISHILILSQQLLD